MPELKYNGRSGLYFGLGGMVAASAVLAIMYTPIHIAYLWIAAALGFTFYRSGYGFTRAWRQLVTAESTIGTRAHLLWILLASLMMFPLFKFGLFGQAKFDTVRPISVMLFAGAFIFAIGMQVAGSCTSGSMYRAGSGQIRLWFSIMGIVLGGVIGAESYGFWLGLPQLAFFSYQREFDLGIAYAIQGGILVSLWLILVALEKRWNGSVTGLFGVRADRVTLAQVRRDGGVSSSIGGFLHGKWSLGMGSVILALLSALALIALNRPWVISTAFPFWGAKIAGVVGLELDFEFWDYWGIPNNEAMLSRGIFEDPTSLMNIAFIVGAGWGAMSLARLKDRVKGDAERAGLLIEWLYRPVTTFIGGVLMGYGAVVGLGCNIGGYMAATISGSVHGWAWVLSALLGTVVGVKLRRLLRL